LNGKLFVSQLKTTLTNNYIYKLINLLVCIKHNASQVNPPQFLAFLYLRASRGASGITYQIHIQKSDVLVRVTIVK